MAHLGADAIDRTLICQLHDFDRIHSLFSCFLRVCRIHLRLGRSSTSRISFLPLTFRVIAARSDRLNSLSFPPADPSRLSSIRLGRAEVHEQLREPGGVSFLRLCICLLRRPQA